MYSQSCPTLCDHMDCSPSGSSIHGIFQARILEWVAISSSRGSSRPRDQTHVSCVSCIGRQILYQLSLQGNPDKKTDDVIKNWTKIKTTMKHECIPIRMTTIKQQVITSVGEDVGVLAPSHFAVGNLKWCN